MEKTSMRWLDKIPYPLLIAAAIFMLGAPFVPDARRALRARRTWSKRRACWPKAG
jgi:hypothetical protein